MASIFWRSVPGSLGATVNQLEDVKPPQLTPSWKGSETLLQAQGFLIAGDPYQLAMRRANLEQQEGRRAYEAAWEGSWYSGIQGGRVSPPVVPPSANGTITIRIRPQAI